MIGKLIVIEGTDGSGKATQTELVCDELNRLEIPYKTLEFPRYNEPSSALIKMYLNGAFGSNPNDVNAYAASTFFAVDRYASYKQDWGKFYENGGLIVADRYTTSNIVHQMSKVEQSEKQKFLCWLEHFEYNLLGLPRPDIVIYLDLPIEITMEMMRDRALKSGEQKDIHESDIYYLQNCQDNAELVIRELGWNRIQCNNGNSVRTIEDIHCEIMQIIGKYIKENNYGR